MKANFASCLDFTLRYEGGMADDPRDPGGRTMEGVTQSIFAAWLNAKGLPSRDVRSITSTERDALYRAGFWDAVKGDALADGVDLAVFDFAVNSGPARALAAYRTCAGQDASAVVRAICGSRLSFLHALGTFKAFGRGWTARVAACEAQGVRMAEHARIGLPAKGPTAPQVATTLQATARAASAQAGRTRKTSLGVGSAAVLAAPAAMTGTSWSWPVIGGLALIALGIAGVLVWRAHRNRIRAAAYASAALA